MDQQSIDNSISNKKSGGREKSNISKISKEFKLLLFGILNLLIKEDDISIYVSGFMAIIEFLQAFIFLFNPQAFFSYNSLH